MYSVESGLNAVLTEQGAVLVDGKPDVFVEDEDFTRLLIDKEFAKMAFEYFGVPICVGRLGKEVEDGVFEESITECSDIAEERPGRGLGYYAKL